MALPVHNKNNKFKIRVKEKWLKNEYVVFINNHTQMSSRQHQQSTICILNKSARILIGKLHKRELHRHAAKPSWQVCKVCRVVLKQIPTTRPLYSCNDIIWMAQQNKAWWHNLSAHPKRLTNNRISQSYLWSHVYQYRPISSTMILRYKISVE